MAYHLSCSVLKESHVNTFANDIKKVGSHLNTCPVKDHLGAIQRSISRLRILAKKLRPKREPAFLLLLLRIGHLVRRLNRLDMRNL